MTYERPVTDILVAAMPQEAINAPGIETYLETQGQLHVLKQFERYPAPRVVFAEIQTHYANSAEELNVIYSTIEHQCTECEEGRQLGLAALAKNEGLTVCVTKLNYTEVWPDGTYRAQLTNLSPN